MPLEMSLHSQWKNSERFSGQIL